MPVNAGTVYVDVRPNTAGFATQLNAQMATAATSAGRTFSQKLQGAAAGLSNVGRSLTRYVSLPLAGIGAVATKTALDYDKAFTQIAAVTNTSQAQVADWKREVLGLAGETARAPQELAEGLYFLASAGLEASQIMPTLEASAKGAAAGLGETSDIARLTANVLNAYPKSALTAADAIDTLVAAVREGTAEPDEFANAMGRILPIASKADVEFEELAASLASLSNIGLDVNEGVTAMRGLLQAITAPTQQSTDALKKMGLTTQELRDSLADDGLIDTLRLLEEQSGGNIDKLRELVPNVRALTGFFGLTEQEARKVDAAFQAVADSTGSLDRAFEKTEKGAAFKFQKAMTDLRVAGIRLGNQIIPILVDDVIPAIQDAIKWFTDLSPAAKDLAVKLGLLAILAGPLLRLAGGLLRVAAGVKTLTSAAIGAKAVGLGAGGAAGGGGLLAWLGFGSAGAGAAALAGVTAGTLGFAKIIHGLADQAAFDEGKAAATAFVTSFQAEMLQARIHEQTGFWDFALTNATIEDKTKEAAQIITDEMNQAIRRGADPEAVQELVDRGFYKLRNAIGGVNEDMEGLRGVVREVLGGDTRREVARSSLLFLDLGDSMGNWIDALKDSGEATTPLARKIAAMRTGFENLIGPMDEVAEQQVLNLISVGDLEGAYKLLRQELNHAYKPLQKNAEAIDRAGEAAADAAQKQKQFGGDTRNAGREAQTAGGKVETYKGKLDVIPPHVKTDVQLTGADAASAAAANLKALLEGLERTYHANVEVIQGHTGGLIRHAGGIVPRMHRGGLSPDEVPIIAQRGEFIMRREAVNRIGIDVLHALNRGKAAAMAPAAPPQRSYGDSARLELRGFHGVNLRFQQDQDWRFAQWGW